MSTIVDRLSSHGAAPAIVGRGGLHVSYADLAARVEAMAERLGGPGRLVVVEAENEIEPIVAYLAALRSRNPVMLTPPGRADLRASVLADYQPEWVHSRGPDGWRLEAPDDDAGATAPTAPHPDLAVLLCTSGSTGASKFVRLSHTNIDANARSIVEYLGITPADCAATTLPFHYSYGFSVLNSHLLVGARLMLTRDSVVDESFWTDCREHGVTSIAGVPYTFELLDRIDFEALQPPSLRYVTQAGGRLAADRILHYEALGRRSGWQLFVMYGQTEASPRMSYVPPDRLATHPDSIGIAIPGGEFRLLGEDGEEIREANRPGELVYRGPNVMMGYAERREDLAAGALLSELATGDLAERDEDGLYRIVGRMKRFLKLFGLRIGLDEVERKLAAEGLPGMATGTDDALVIATLEAGAEDRIREKIAAWCKIPPAVIRVRSFEDHPRLASGKVDYTAIRAAVESEARRADADSSTRDVRSIIREATHAEAVDGASTFVQLGGDSLSYIRASLALEALLGYVPPGWERIPIAELEALDRKRSPWHQVETSILLRAVAILLIVCNHFGTFDLDFFQSIGFRYPGSAATILLVVAGMNFARFQLPTAAVKGAVPILHTLWRIALPSALFLLVVETVSGKFVWSTILMYSNLISPNLNYGIEPWFIYVFVQILALLALLFAIAPLRELVARRPYRSALSLLALSIVMSLAGPLVWDTAYLFDRIPHMLLYTFALGICIGLGQQTWQKLLHSALLVLFYLVSMSHYTWLVLAGCLVLVWIPTVWLVQPFNRIAGTLGSASLFIYLSHYNFKQYANRLLETESIAVELVVALGGGVLLWLAWERGTALAGSISRHAWARLRGPRVAVEGA